MTITREQFFRMHLVPAAQIIEALLQLNTTRPSGRGDLAQKLKEPLNLVALYVLNPETKSTFKSLAVAVDALTDAMLPMVRPYLTGKAPTPTQRIALRKELDKFKENQKNFVAGIYAQLSYFPAKRTEWLAEQMRHPTRLTKDGQSSKWTTFVRNLNFEESLSHLNVAGISRHVNHLASSTGKEQVGALWNEVFSFYEPTRKTAGASRLMLPNDIKVVSTQLGMLMVTATFQPALRIKRDAKAPKVTPAEMMDDFSPKTFSAECDYMSLPAVVERAQAWFKEEEGKVVAVQNRYDTLLEAAKLETLRAKMAKNFTADELELMKKLLPQTEASKK